MADAKVNGVRKLKRVDAHLNPVVTVAATKGRKPVAGTLQPNPNIRQAGHGIVAVFDSALLHCTARGSVVVPPETLRRLLSSVEGEVTLPLGRGSECAEHLANVLQ